MVLSPRPLSCRKSACSHANRRVLRPVAAVAPTADAADGADNIYWKAKIYTGDGPRPRGGRTRPLGARLGLYLYRFRRGRMRWRKSPGHRSGRRICHPLDHRKPRRRQPGAGCAGVSIACRRGRLEGSLGQPARASNLLLLTRPVCKPNCEPITSRPRRHGPGWREAGHRRRPLRPVWSHSPLRCGLCHRHKARRSCP